MECSEHSEDSSTLRLELSGRMTFNDHHEMKRITRLMVSERKTRVIVDLSSLQFIDSAAIGMLLIIAEAVREIGGTMLLENAQGQVARVLAVTKIYELMPHR